MNGVKESLAEQIVRGELCNQTQVFGSARAVLFSGASDGADTLFGKMALEHQHHVVHFLGPRNRPSDEAASTQAECLCHVTDDLLDSPTISRAAVRAALAICGGMRRGMDGNTHSYCDKKNLLDGWRDSRRNFLQVRRAEVN